jgi:hypothetical protein
MNNIIVRQYKKWWQTDAAKIGLGAVLGFAICRAK